MLVLQTPTPHVCSKNKLHSTSLIYFITLSSHVVVVVISVDSQADCHFTLEFKVVLCRVVRSFVSNKYLLYCIVCERAGYTDSRKELGIKQIILIEM